MKKKIKKLLVMGHIKLFNSFWSVSILFVQKKDDTLRMCINYHTLNTVTMWNEYPLLHIDIIFNHLAKTKYFSILDLNMTYYQVQLDDESKNYTVFTYKKEHFQFKVMIFRFTNTPHTFQYMMTDYLYNIVSYFIKVYLDVYSKTWKEHLMHL
jgi:hypothetical protein